jgi:hypothetical protein
MVSFERIVSLLALQQMMYRYKMIYSFKEIYCILLTNHKNHVQWTDAYFQHLYHRENDSRHMMKLLTKEQFWVYSIADSKMFQLLYKLVNEYAAQSLSHDEEKMDQVDCAGGTLVYYHRKKLFILSDHDFKRVYIIAGQKNKAAVYEPARMIREIVTRSMERKGFFLLHAAAVEKDGQVVLFCGDKSTGKTTMMLGLLSLGYNLISNDKVYIGIENRQVKVYSCPGPVGITLETLMHFPLLQRELKRLPRWTFPQHRLHPEAMILVETGLAETDYSKLDLSMTEVASIMKRRLVREATLQQIVILGDFAETSNFQRITDTQTAIGLLKKHFFFPRNDYNYPPSDPSYPQWYGINNQAEKWQQLFEVTVGIMAKLLPIRVWSKRRVTPVQAKIRKMDAYLQKLRASSG